MKNKIWLLLLIPILLLLGCQNNVNPLADLNIEVDNKEVFTDFHLPLYLNYGGEKYKLSYETDNNIIKIIEKEDYYLAQITKSNNDTKTNIKVKVTLKNKNHSRDIKVTVTKKGNITNDIVILYNNSNLELQLTSIVETLKYIYPKYNFEMINYYSSLDSEITELEANGKKPNLIFGDSTSLNKYKYRTDIVDLADFIDEDFKKLNLNKVAFKQGNYNNKQIMIPYSMSSDIVRVNMHFINYLVENNYISTVKANDIKNWSWDDYMEINNIITSKLGTKPNLYASDSFSNSVILRLLQTNAISDNGYDKNKIIEILKKIKSEYDNESTNYVQLTNFTYMAYLAPYNENEPKDISTLFANNSLTGALYDNFNLECMVIPPFKEENSNVRLYANCNSMMMFNDDNRAKNNIIWQIILSLLDKNVQATFVNGLIPINYDAYNTNIYDMTINERFSSMQEMIKNNYNYIACLPLEDEIIEFYLNLNNVAKDIMINNKIEQVVSLYFK